MIHIITDKKDGNTKLYKSNEYTDRTICANPNIGS